jgi:hypothetical protein
MNQRNRAKFSSNYRFSFLFLVGIADTAVGIVCTVSCDPTFPSYGNHVNEFLLNNNDLTGFSYLGPDLDLDLEILLSCVFHEGGSGRKRWMGKVSTVHECN